MRQQPPPICLTTSPATITGTLAEANVIAVPAQGIDAGADGFCVPSDAIAYRDSLATPAGTGDAK